MAPHTFFSAVKRPEVQVERPAPFRKALEERSEFPAFDTVAAIVLGDGPH